MSEPSVERLDADATSARLDWVRLIAALRRAVVELAGGVVVCPPRSVVPLADGAVLLSMPAVAPDIAIHKLITVAPANAWRGLPVILGSVTVLDPVSGRVRMVLDGPTVTGRRTAAMSLLATALLARGPLAKVLVVGTGVQAASHVAALAALHPHVAVRIRGSSPVSADAFCAARADIASSPRPCAPGEDDFDVVFTCTTSRTPVHRGPAGAGRLIVATGAFEPGAAEVDAAVVRASTVYVDDPSGARHEAGDLLQAGVDWALVRPLADALAPGHRPPARPLLFKSVGCAAWDLAAARVAQTGQ